MSTLTRTELAQGIAKKFGLPVEKAKAILLETLLVIGSALTDNRRVEFRGFGVFQPVTRKAKVGRNPQRPEAGTVVIPARRSVRFHVGHDLDQFLNQPETEV